jgi:hypothetical protein
LTGVSSAMGTGKRSPVPLYKGLCLFFLVPLLALSACGDKVPESSAAKQVGEAPKQIVDKVAADAAAAASQGAKRSESEQDRK